MLTSCDDPLWTSSNKIPTLPIAHLFRALRRFIVIPRQVQHSVNDKMKHLPIGRLPETPSVIRGPFRTKVNFCFERRLGPFDFKRDHVRHPIVSEGRAIEFEHLPIGERNNGETEFVKLWQFRTGYKLRRAPDFIPQSRSDRKKGPDGWRLEKCKMEFQNFE